MRVRLSMKQLAEVLGVGAITISRWERGRVTPSGAAQGRVVAMIARFDAGAALRLAQALGLPPPAGATPSRSATALAAFEQAVQLGADTMDLPPRKVRAAFIQLLLQLRAANASLDDLAELASPAPKTT